MVYYGIMTSPEWQQPQSDRFVIVRQIVPTYSLQRPGSQHYNDDDEIVLNRDEITEFETAIAALYNGSAGGSVHDKIYIAPMPDSRRVEYGTLLFVIDTQDPSLGLHSEQADDGSLPLTNIMTVAEQSEQTESV